MQIYHQVNLNEDMFSATLDPHRLHEEDESESMAGGLAPCPRLRECALTGLPSLSLLLGH